MVDFGIFVLDEFWVFFMATISGISITLIHFKIA